MKADQTIALDAKELADLLSIAVRKKAVEQVLNHNTTEVDALLAPFCNGDRETYLDGDYTIDDVEFDDDHTGTISVSFDGDVYLGCKDMDHLEHHGETLAFTIDPETGNLRLEAEHPEEREPDDI